MKLEALPPPSELNYLLSFDFDDTLFDPLYPGHVPSLFFEAIRQWRNEYGLIWGINTGRDYEFLQTGYIDQVKAPFAPDFVITMERNIHLADENLHLRSLSSWNSQCSREHEALFRHRKRALDQLMEELRDSCPGVIWWNQESDPYSIEVDNPDGLELLAQIIDPWLIEYPDLSAQRAGPYLRFCHAAYNKGTALEEVLRLFGISSQSAFIAGDGYNDMDAMKHIEGALCACPDNAADALKQLVISKRGYVSPYARGKGLEDIIQQAIKPWLGSKTR